ncbi:hypothetical protein D3C87_77540 [compost metagenome]
MISQNSIQTEEDNQFFFSSEDTIHTPINQRGPKMVITLNGYLLYSVDTSYFWRHKGEEKGIYKITKLIWENGKTILYIKHN